MTDDRTVQMWLPDDGHASHDELVSYVRAVLSENTTLKPGYNPTGSFDKLAGGMVYSILHRLNIRWENTGKMVLPPIGSIGLVKVVGLVGGLIRVGQWLDGDGFADYEHAFVLTSGTCLTDAQIIEAEPGGVRRGTLVEYLGRKVLWLRCPAAFSTRVGLAAMTYLDVDYSVADYFDIAMKRLKLPAAEPLRWLVESNHHVICSQMATAAAEKGGWQLFSPDTWPGYVTPAHLSKLVPTDTEPQLIE